MRLMSALPFVLVASHAASAQVLYRVTNLGVAPGEDVDSESIRVTAVGLNNHGEVVGTTETIDGVFAYVWVPTPNYGLSANTQVFLNGPTIPFEAVTAEATAINDFGIITGANRSVDPIDAIVWVADSNGVPFPTHTPVGLIAHNVTNADVGEAIVVGAKAASEDEDGPHTDGFYYTLDDFVTIGLEQGNPDDFVACSALDVSTPAAATEAVIVGERLADALQGNCAIIASNGDAVYWTSEICLPPCPGAAELEQPDSFSPIGSPDLERNGEARGVNDATVPFIVGWGEDQQNNCLIRALLWEGVDDEDPIPLGEEPGEETFAEAINNADPVQAVGRNETLGQAYLWERSTFGVWGFSDLDSLIDATACDVALGHAYDINDNGWIVATGRARVAEGLDLDRAFLLVPLGPCPEDVDQDGDVDPDDEAMVIANRGQCPVGAICWADVNGDCVVNATDQAMVRAAILSGSCSGGGEAASSGGCLCPAEIVMQFGDDICGCAAWMSALEDAGGL